MCRQRSIAANEVGRRNNRDAELGLVFFLSGPPPEVAGGENMFGQSSFSLEVQRAKLQVVSLRSRVAAMLGQSRSCKKKVFHSLLERGDKSQ